MSSDVKVSGAFDARAFRDALSAFATGVTIVTACDAAGKPVGMTASSFNSVSMEPPLILWSVTKSALSAAAFRDAGHFAVHVLASDQVDLSNRFATKGADKFEQTTYTVNENGVALLEGAVACFECSNWKTYEGGDHWIIVGEVQRFTKVPGESLAFCAGSYATAEPVRSSVHESDVADTPGHGSESEIDDLLLYQLSRAYRQMSFQFHQTVRDGGLSVAEWRVLASLHGRATLSLRDLSTRTFVDPAALADMVYSMQEQQLCEVLEEQGVMNVLGTERGHERVAHLFALGKSMEAQALHDAGPDAARQLKQLLQRVVNNTDPVV